MSSTWTLVTNLLPLSYRATKQCCPEESLICLGHDVGQGVKCYVIN